MVVVVGNGMCKAVVGRVQRWDYAYETRSKLDLLGRERESAWSASQAEVVLARDRQKEGERGVTFTVAVAVAGAGVGLWQGKRIGFEPFASDASSDRTARKRGKGALASRGRSQGQ